MNRAEVEHRVAHVNDLLQAHAGGIELVEVDTGGAVLLRFTGFCTGCPYRPLTLAATVRPALQAIDGVTAVEVVGSRVSEEAEERMRRYLAPGPSF